MGSIPIARSSVPVFMISCKFQIPSELVNEVDAFLEREGFDNVSVFENAKFGFSERLDENSFPIAKFFDVEILLNTADMAKYAKDILCKQFGDEIHSFIYSPLKEDDWVSAYLSELKPVVCDTFYLYNETIQSLPDHTNPENSRLIPIRLNSALAFGSGHHQTTQACLLNMRYLFEHENRNVKNILDMGCGTGILGICALKLWKDSKLLGMDIDSEAVRIARDNYEANGINAMAMVGNCPPKETDGFDLVFCNILKQPLIDLCSEFEQIMNNHAYIVTSGFILSQEREIAEVYMSHGFENVNRIQLDDWLSIIFRKK